MRIIVGIDEVGRGPLAGPVTIGIVVCRTVLAVPGLTDSKKMTEAAREKTALIARELQKDGAISFGVFSAPAERVDAFGIETCIKNLIARGLSHLAPEPNLVEVKLDGRLKAPAAYRQEAIIHGDALVPEISLASVVAKVARDRYMKETLHPKFPEYGFDAHKGYGTAAHIAAIKEHGPSPYHRRSFLTRVLPSADAARSMVV